MLNVWYQCLLIDLFFLIHTSVYFYKTDSYASTVSCSPQFRNRFLCIFHAKINRNGAPESLEPSAAAQFHWCFMLLPQFWMFNWAHCSRLSWLIGWLHLVFCLKVLKWLFCEWDWNVGNDSCFGISISVKMLLCFSMGTFSWTSWRVWTWLFG